MDFEEFYRLLDESVNGFKEYKETRDKFKSTLVNELLVYVYKEFPTPKPLNDKIKEELRAAAEICAMMSFDSFERACTLQAKNGVCTSRNFAPVVIAKELSEVKLNEFLLTLPKECHDEIKRMHWEKFEHHRIYQIYEKGLHDKIKEVLVMFFEEDILEFTSDSFRSLESLMTYYAYDSFRESVYELLEE